MSLYKPTTNSMLDFLTQPFRIGSLTLPHRLIQGPLAGYSCAPFRTQFNKYLAPAYCVSEMCSAQDVLHKHQKYSRYLYRSPEEKILAYQIAGKDKFQMADAALYLQTLGADLIDLNCGCPKSKIRKKGAGSALLETPQHLLQLIQQVRQSIHIPLTVKIRIQGNEQDIWLAKNIEAAGADALIVHGRHWLDDYDKACNLQQIAHIKQQIAIPVIANGDIKDKESLQHTLNQTGCDAFMLSRAGSGQPWLYQELLEEQPPTITLQTKINLFITHLQNLASLESEIQAVLQSKSLVRYYLREHVDESQIQIFYQLQSLQDINHWLRQI